MSTYYIGIDLHTRTSQRPETQLPELSAYSGYFDSCRSKRNIMDYDRAGEITETETAALLQEASIFSRAVTRQRYFFGAQCGLYVPSEQSRGGCERA